MKKKFCLSLINFMVLCLSMLSGSGLWGLSLKFDTIGLHFNNGDFNNYNHQTYILNKSNQLYNTDDRGWILFADLRLNYNTQYKKTEFFIDVSRLGYWGTDNLQGRDNGQNPVLFNRLNFIYYPTEAVSIQLGRYSYQIGEALIDYFFHDVVDGVQFNYKILKELKINFLFDIMSIAYRVPDAGIFSIVRKDSEDQNGFQGDYISMRFGFSVTYVLENQIPFIEKPGIMLFSYLVRYGGSTQGSADLSEDGKNDLNQVDNDFLTMSGIRLFKQIKEDSKVDITFAYSYGRDNQFTEANSRIYNGMGVALNYEQRFSVIESLISTTILTSLGYFHQDFASMKPRSMGGTLLWGFKGYHASPYAYFYHFRDYGKNKSAPERVDATNSKTFFKLNNTWNIAAFSGEIIVLALFQTLGFEYMGTELEFNLSYRIDNIELTLNPAFFVPSHYYPKLAANNAFISNGQDTFYAVRFVTSYVLDLDYIASTKKDKEKKDETEKILETPKETIE